MVDGLEWNVRISNVSTPALTRKFEATFDTYWNDPAFKAYDPATDAERLDTALAEAGGSGSGRETITVSGLDVKPYPHQERILEALEAARVVHDQHRNLVVAATGTGKTVVAALDYLRPCADEHSDPTLLFVAHRKEILEQSLRKYREVLGDGSFGELFVDGRRPSKWRHVFASIQSLSGPGGRDIHPGDFDVVVIDEFHHAAASTYTNLLSRVEPRELLGLTATPERSDSLDILHWFGGRATYELRLWDALEQDLLCPFHYFGIADNTDLRGITWSRGDYNQSDLENVYTGNDARTRLILNAVRERVVSPRTMRALGFCVSIAHAEYMAREFTRQGVPSVALSAGTSSPERADAFRRLRHGEGACLFAVDIFNEGLDIPDVDTLLMLRPTQSATVFLQQLGRGLRRSKGKAVLTVLDFIGHQRAEFNFSPRFTALTGARGQRLVDEIADEFPFLPGASRLVLDQQAQEIILDSVKHALPKNRRSALVESVRQVKTSVLGDYLQATGGELSDIYSGSGTRAWTPLLRDAGLLDPTAASSEEPLLRRVRALAHVDDPERADIYRQLASPEGPRYEELSARGQAYARMLFMTLWPDHGGFSSYDAGFAFLREHPAVGSEIRQILDVSVAKYSPRAPSHGERERHHATPHPRAIPARGGPCGDRIRQHQAQGTRPSGWGHLERWNRCTFRQSPQRRTQVQSDHDVPRLLDLAYRIPLGVAQQYRPRLGYGSTIRGAAHERVQDLAVRSRPPRRRLRDVRVPLLGSRRLHLSPGRKTHRYHLEASTPDADRRFRERVGSGELI